MLKTIIKKIGRTIRLNKKLPEKTGLAAASIRLYITGIFYPKSKKFWYTSFLGLKASAYTYKTLDFLFDEIFIGNEYYFESNDKNPLIIDCGANIGFATLFFKKLYPNAKVICFEANPYAFELLKLNAEQNNFTNMELYNEALSDKEGDISFFIGHKETLHGSLSSERGGEEKINCKAVLLSNYIKQYDKIDFIKIDVEGAEWLILDDLVTTGAIKKVNQFIIEYHHKMSSEPSRLSSFLKIMEENGFEYNIKADYFSKGDFQDILIHFFTV